MNKFKIGDKFIVKKEVRNSERYQGRIYVVYNISTYNDRLTVRGENVNTSADRVHLYEDDCDFYFDFDINIETIEKNLEILENKIIENER